MAGGKPLPDVFANENDAADAIWSDCLGVKFRSNGGGAPCTTDPDEWLEPPSHPQRMKTNGGNPPTTAGEEPSLEPGPAEPDTTARPAGKLSERLRAAVAAAIVAYERSGRMVDAALAYAAHGFPIFPVTEDKIPVPARDRDADGKPIPGTGGFKKATTDPIQIQAWWRKGEYLIGLPMGPVSGLSCIDIDTSEDHADGVAEWHKIAAQHEPIVTREHRSATGGPHLIFVFDPDWPIGCSSGKLPKGIEVKGGGYIVAPPSRRKGRAYTVHHDIDPGPMPQWLLDLITAGRPQ